MKKCPHCCKEAAETAVRCRYCRRALSREAGPSFWDSLFPKVLRALPQWRITGVEEKRPSWGLLEAGLLWVLVFVGSWAIQRSEAGFHAVEFLRRRFFIFTKEPLLQLYVYREFCTFLLKLGVILLIGFLLWWKKESWAALALGGGAREGRRSFTFLFFLFSLLMAFWFGMDPLVPDLPSSLFFAEAALLGNGVILFSLLITAPVTEEIFFRGFMYPVFWKMRGTAFAVGASALLFALAHAPQMGKEPFYLFSIFLGGILIGMGRAITGSTRYAIFLHALYNLTSVAIGWWRYQIFK